ncbi:unnamed protein product [Rodentolepis nana]|uniref:C2H2-type domain-containing protein n=1 Tax=Rodentolepis nana TaxID=102285 RepID=A0A0R3TQ31_RODNA|nr:unnamed protein product [Rodentolepis nana]
MNLLSSSNPPSLPSAPPPQPTSPQSSTESLPPKATSIRKQKSSSKSPESPMTITMAFNSGKSRPLDLSATDRSSVEISTPLECPKLIKMEDSDERTSGNEDKSSENEKHSHLKAEIEDNKSTVKQSSESSDQTQSKSDELSSQVKVLTEFFKTLSSTSTPIDATVASLQALIAKKSEKEDANSLEALHQLGWQLINLGRGNPNAPNPPPIPTSTSVPLWIPGNRPPVPSSQSIQTPSTPSQQSLPHPHPPMSGISMRGNQKYSAFYQHNRKHQSTEESESFRQSTAPSVPQFHRVGFPSRRISGPGLPNQTRCHFPNSSESTLKPTGMGPRMQNELISPPRSRETAFLCSCGEDFESLYVFTLHMRDTGHKPRSSQPERDIPKLVRGQDMWINSETEQTREILRCMRCNQSFRSLPELTMHMMKTSHYSEIVYSDAGRNLLASQTFSSSDRNRSGGSSTNSSSWGGGLKSNSASMAMKRPIRGSGAAPPQNGLSVPPEALKTNSESEKKVNGHPENLQRSAIKSPRLEEPPKCERPASSHEMHLVKPSPKPAVSPEALSCPSELQRSGTSSPRNENDKPEQKYLNSPTSSRENNSPRASGDEQPRRGCTDSVIRQIESFVENSLPFSSASSPVSSRNSNWPPQRQQQSQNVAKPTMASSTAFGRCNLSPMAETETSRSTPDKNVSRKRRFSSGSSNSAAPARNSSTEAPADKRPLLGFSAEAGENPLSSLQKLVETTHQSGAGMKSPMRPFSQASEISPSPSNHSNDIEASGNINANISKTCPTTLETGNHQPNIAAALSALQNIMSKVSPCASNQQQTPPNFDFLLPTSVNSEGENANLMGLLSAVLNAAKQSESDQKRPEGNMNIGNLPSPSKIFEQSVFTGGGFDFAKSTPLSVHMNPPTMTTSGPSMVANITKKAKCHFCGKPFANKGQVRLHISKNKCPCLLQQSAMAKPPSSSGNMTDKRRLPFPYPGFSHGAPDLSRFFSPPPPQHHQQSNPQTSQPCATQASSSSQGSQQKPLDSKPPAEAAALAALLRHFNAPPTSARASSFKPADLLASLSRPSDSNSSSLNALFSILFSGNAAPPPPPPPPQPIDTSGMSPEQKALMLFAQAVVSLAVATPTKAGDEISQSQVTQPPPTIPAYPPPLINLLHNFNITPPTPIPTQDSPGLDNPDGLINYLSALRQIVSIGNPGTTSSPATVSTPNTSAPTTTLAIKILSATGDNTAVASKESE